jgi:hypothetical protein
MKIRYLAFTVAALHLFQWSPAEAETAGARERSGLSCISSKPFPVPDGSKVISGFSADFETPALPQGWAQGMGGVVTADDAPQGKAYFRMPAKKGADLHSSAIAAQGGIPYFLSLWIKAPLEPWMTISFASDERERSYGPLHVPLYYQLQPADSWNQWRQMGFYFWMPLQCKTIQLIISTRNESPDGFICVDDIRLRAATDAEMSAAYKNEKSNFPPYDVQPHPGDGKNLVLSVAKWEGRAGIPGKPFVIWALGSSFTDFQGGDNGYELIDAIRQRFPNAPPIIYRKHGGPGTPWEYIDGWINQFVAFEEPDLIFTYTSGSLEGLDAMLTDIRRRTTADIIVPSLHFRPPPSDITPMNITHGMGVAWDSVREICEKHGAEFVANREELAAYLAQTGLDQDALLYDHNHQGMHGRIRIWDNIFAHLIKSSQPAYAPESRERRIPVNPVANTATEQVSLSGNWSKANGAVRTSAAGAKLTVAFTGNQIDLLGHKAPGGGNVKVLIDGVPAGQSSVFVTNCIQSSKGNWRIPHEIELGKDLVPQKWTITMTSDVGDYRVEGSVAGPDGTGNLTQRFLSKSGQIGIDPRFWRDGRRAKAGPDQYGNVIGETFTFDVMRGVLGEVDFKGDQGTSIAEPLARNLANGRHTLELVTTGDGDVEIDGFYVYQPPEKGNP